MHYLNRILITSFLIFSTAQLFAQVCKGTLGEPIVSAGTNFGQGTTTFGAALNTNTTYTYISGTPNDGQYTVAKTTTGLNPGWVQNITNHTPNDPNGYMMIVNADINKGVFYQATVGDLCANTTYQFSAFIINILNHSGIKPKVSFSVFDAQGNLLSPPYDTGDIPEGSSSNWVEYGTSFTTPATAGPVTIKMTNENPGGNGNDLALDDITFRACGPTISPSLNGSNAEINICEGTSGSYSLNAVVSDGYTKPSFQWQINTGNGWSDLAGEKTTNLSAIFNNATTGIYQYRLVAAEGDNINSVNCRVVSAPLIINVNAYPVATAENTGPFCIGTTIQLNASGGITYSWTGPNGFNSNLKNPAILNATQAMAGNYMVSVTTNGCSATASTNVGISDPIIATTNITTGTICEGSSLSLSASGGKIYSWFPATGLSDPNISNPIASPKETTTYSVTVTDGGCSSVANILLIVNKNAAVDAGTDQKILTGQSIQLNGKVTGTDVSYFWTPTDYLDDPTKLNPISTPITDITYTLHAQSSLGCLNASDDIFIKVYPKVIIPNSFSPNGDSINDTWNIPAATTFPNPIVKITNRYGQLVYQSTGTFIPWDGKFKGKDLPSAVYYYSVYLNEDFKTYTGWIMLVR